MPLRPPRGSPYTAGVSGPLRATGAPIPPEHVQVYGVDHSPWVQAVLLGLHERGIAHTPVTVPPLSVFLRSGILMPAAKLDDGPWLLDSECILVELGFSPVDADVRRALQTVFLSGAFERTDDPWQFWRRFSEVRDGHPSAARRLWNQFWRAFATFYFFTAITIGRRTAPRATTEQLAQRFLRLQEWLSPGETFFGGGTPDTVDLQLFGIVQMYASIPGPSHAVLRGDAQLTPLRAWAEAMQRRCAGYTHLYSARSFEPKLPEIESAPLHERVAFWLGAATMWIALPITLPMVLFFVRRVRRMRVRRPRKV